MRASSYCECTHLEKIEAAAACLQSRPGGVDGHGSAERLDAGRLDVDGHEDGGRCREERAAPPSAGPGAGPAGPGAGPHGVRRAAQHDFFPQENMAQNGPEIFPIFARRPLSRTDPAGPRTGGRRQIGTMQDHSGRPRMHRKESGGSVSSRTLRTRSRALTLARDRALSMLNNTGSFPKETFGVNTVQKMRHADSKRYTKVPRIYLLTCPCGERRAAYSHVLTSARYPWTPPTTRHS